MKEIVEKLNRIGRFALSLPDITFIPLKEGPLMQERTREIWRVGRFALYKYEKIEDLPRPEPLLRETPYPKIKRPEFDKVEDLTEPAVRETRYPKIKRE